MVIDKHGVTADTALWLASPQHLDAASQLLCVFNKSPSPKRSCLAEGYEGLGETGFTVWHRQIRAPCDRSDTLLVFEGLTCLPPPMHISCPEHLTRSVRRASGFVLTAQCRPKIVRNLHEHLISSASVLNCGRSAQIRRTRTLARVRVECRHSVPIFHEAGPPSGRPLGHTLKNLNNMTRETVESFADSF
jgi:hypothetical protein